MVMANGHKTTELEITLQCGVRRYAQLRVVHTGLIKVRIQSKVGIKGKNTKEDAGLEQ